MKEEETLLNLFYEANIILTPKPDKDTNMTKSEENYAMIFIINVDQKKTLNKILANWIQKHKKRITRHDQWSLQHTKSNQRNIPLYKEVHRFLLMGGSLEDKITYPLFAHLRIICVKPGALVFKNFSWTKRMWKLHLRQKSLPLVALVSMTWVRIHSLWVISSNSDRRNIAFGQRVNLPKEKI